MRKNNQGRFYGKKGRRKKLGGEITNLNTWELKTRKHPRLAIFVHKLEWYYDTIKKYQETTRIVKGKSPVTQFGTDNLDNRKSMYYGSIKVIIKAVAGLDRVGWIRSSKVRGKFRLT